MDADLGGEEIAALRAEVARLAADNRGLRLALSGLGAALTRAAEVSYSSEQNLSEPGVDLRIGEDGRDGGALDGLGREVAEMDREAAGRDA